MATFALLGGCVCHCGMCNFAVCCLVNIVVSYSLDDYAALWYLHDDVDTDAHCAESCKADAEESVLDYFVRCLYGLQSAKNFQVHLAF